MIVAISVAVAVFAVVKLFYPLIHAFVSRPRVTVTGGRLERDGGEWFIRGNPGPSSGPGWSRQGDGPLFQLPDGTWAHRVPEHVLAIDITVED